MKTNKEWLAEIPNSVKATWMMQIKNREARELGYRNHSHRQNSESAMKHLEEQSKTPLVLEEVLANQRKREQQEEIMRRNSK